MLASLAAVISGQELPVITLKRTACFGTCPIYSLEIFEDGGLRYNGTQFVAAIGPRQAQISPGAVKALIDSFLKIRYFDLKDVYETHQNPDGTSEWISDLPTTYTSLRVGNRIKSVKDYAFSPEKLRMLELEIDRVANTHQWIHEDDDLKKWELVGPDIYGRTKPGMNLLMQAAGKGDTKTIANEHAIGTDANAQDETGWTALMLAGEQSRETTVRQLLDWNAKVDLRDKHGDDALMGAASAFCYFPEARKAQVNIIKLLIARGADPNGRDYAGLTPLMTVTTYGNIAAARVLIDAGASLDSKDNDARTPLDHARSALEKYHEHDWANELRQLVKLLEDLGKPTHIGAPTPD
jgi:hypothetical protein